MNENYKDITAFQNIIENKDTIRYLKNSILNNKVSHSYIFDGYSKTAKESIAREFARLLLCENNGSIINCKCTSCIGMKSNSNPDFFLIEPKTDIFTIVEVKDKILKNMETKPFKYKYKVFIIKNAHTMNLQAQNALLKTIEEPPLFAIFILLSRDYTKLLPTILSRCMLFKMELLPSLEIERYLINKGIKKENATIFSSYSKGSLGRAIELAELSNKNFTLENREDLSQTVTINKFFELKAYILNDISVLEDITLIEMYDLIEKYEKLNKDNKDKNKNIILDILDIYMMVYRDSLIYKQISDTKYLTQKDKEYLILIRNISSKSVLNITKKIKAIIDAKNQLEKNINYSMVMECLFIKLKTKNK